MFRCSNNRLKWGGIINSDYESVGPPQPKSYEGGKEGQAVMVASLKFSGMVAVWEYVADLRTAATGSQNSLNDWERIKITLVEKQRRQRLIQHTEPSRKHAS